MKKLLTSFLIAFSLFLIAAPAALADSHPAEVAEEGAEGEEAADKVPAKLIIPKPSYLPGPTKESQGEDTRNFLFDTTVPRLLNQAIGLLGITAFLGIIIASFTMLTAFGNEDKYNKAKTNLRYAILGFLIVMLSYAIVAIISAVALPSEEAFMPIAHAVDVEEAQNILFPKESELIGKDIEKYDVSLPSGDLISEIIPAIVTNVLYLIGFLVFIALMYGGVLLVIGRGNEEMTTKAKNIVIYSIVALALITGGYAIIYGIATINLNEDPTSDSDDVFVETVQ
ncbi:hypothetical protein HOD30_01605 [Candidatus Peregrinibacteria bacterium]|jgi:hypothetical protein|nr:hypothetical protein [Candidatus Peregrinibacteria bacterium]MBT4632200.1 hypothetical protein [Candidatus Peregrinibacteria bacterium]MBT5516463.1 hypothetical protein [Candidatus Peregrinibacteria bacterium]MBT5824389.1 hypothetical protein [Candidatus Peregrinibacteria bacterium]